MKRIIAIITTIIISLSSLNTYAYATDNLQVNKFAKTETAFLSSCGEKDSYDGVICIFNLVADILTIGVGVFGVLSITIVGIQYLTAGDNEEKVRTAKRRLLEIVIGVAAYVVAYSLLKFLLPNFGSIYVTK